MNYFQPSWLFQSIRLLSSHSVAWMKHFPVFGDKMIIHRIDLVYFIICFIASEIKKEDFCEIHFVKNYVASVSCVDQTFPWWVCELFPSE
jgi:hypothetical protein